MDIQKLIGDASQADIPAIVSDLLKMALEGSIKQLAIVVETEDGGITSDFDSFSNMSSPFMLLGAIRVLEHDIMAQCIGELPPDL